MCRVEYKQHDEDSRATNVNIMISEILTMRVMMIMMNTMVVDGDDEE